MKNLNDERELLSKPGDTILESLEHLRMSQTELAERMGKSPSKINDLISGKEPITTNTAIQLERVLGVSTQFWLNREALYREKLLRIEQEEALDECVAWLKEQPVKELKKLGYIKTGKVGGDMVEETLKFYAVVSPKEWTSIYISDYANADFKKSAVSRTSLSAMAAFLRIGELEAQQKQLPEFNKVTFKENLSKIRLLASEHPEDFALQLISLCEASGVALIYSPSFPGAPISGVARWVKSSPLIQLTDRYKTNDHFWSAFFHEAAHILLHGKKDVFIEEFEGVTVNVEKEIEANEFSDEWLLPRQFINEISGSLTEREIRKIANVANIHPGIVVGVLQKKDKLKYSMYNNLKLKVYLEPYFFNAP